MFTRQQQEQGWQLLPASLQVVAAQTSLDANKEELFDVISCYFPISFSPPPNTVHAITRQDLAAALQDALTCTPLFAPLFIPMLVEKLCSSLRCPAPSLLSRPQEDIVGCGLSGVTESSKLLFHHI